MCLMQVVICGICMWLWGLGNARRHTPAVLDADTVTFVWGKPEEA